MRLKAVTSVPISSSPSPSMRWSRSPCATARVPAREDLAQVELLLAAPLVEELLERVPPREETLTPYPGGELAREAERRPGQILVVGVRDLERSLERVLHLAVEPALDRVL